MDESEAARTRPADLARDLIEGIASGRFAVGSLLPTEMELCERYAASRYAVRLALAELQQRGLVSRRKNVGTRVASATPSTTFRQSLASVEDLVQFGAAHVRAVREVRQVVASAALAREIGCVAGSRWLRVSSLRFDDGESSPPIGWTDVYVDAAYADVGDAVRQAPATLISDLIEQRHGRRIRRIRQDIAAVAMPAAHAETLSVAPDSPALKVVRRYFDDDDRVFEVSVTLHPAERFTVSMLLERTEK